MMFPTLLLSVALLTPDEETLSKARALVQSQDYDGAVALLAPLVKAEPENVQAWLAYGLALQKHGELDKALEAHEKAAGSEETKHQAMYNTAATYALKGDADEAFDWLGRLKATGKYNLSDIGIDGDLKTIKEDPRFQKLLPTPEEFADPFVERTAILHEWDGEAENDWFGWIARNIGDVDGDGTIDFLLTSAWSAVNGSRSGRMYILSGK